MTLFVKQSVPFFSPLPLARFQQAMGGVPAWADRENRKKSKQATSDSKETFYCSNVTCCASLFNLWKKDLFLVFDKSLCV